MKEFYDIRFKTKFEYLQEIPCHDHLFRFQSREIDGDSAYQRTVLGRRLTNGALK